MYFLGYLRVFLCVIALFVASSATADLVEGSKVMRMIEAGQRLDAGNAVEGDVQLDAQFTGYMQGLVDSLVHTKVLCLPPKTTIDQIRRIVMKYAKVNPKSQNGPGAGVVFFAFPSSYMCKN